MATEEVDMGEPSYETCRQCGGNGFLVGDGFSEDTKTCVACGGSGGVLSRKRGNEKIIVEPEHVVAEAIGELREMREDAIHIYGRIERAGLKTEFLVEVAEHISRLEGVADSLASIK